MTFRPQKRLRIALLIYGRSALDELGLRPQDASGERLRAWLRKMPELQVLANVQPFFLSTGKRSPVNVASWEKLARWLFANRKRFDGFVVLHELETLLYTANAMAFSLQHFGKPVIFTGSPVEIAHVHGREPRLGDLLKGYELLGFKVNLLNSVQVATLDVGETVIMFGNRLIRAVRALRSRSVDTNFFDTFGDEYLGIVDFGVKLTGRHAPRRKPKGKSPARLEHRIFALDLHPGFDLSTLGSLPLGAYRGVIVRYTDQTLLGNFLDFIRPRLHPDAPVVLYSRSVVPRGRNAPNTVFVNNASYEATFTKLMWALGATGKLKEARKLLARNVLGEVVSV